jgi:transposase
MLDKEKVDIVINYILDGNTIAEVKEKTNLSESTIKNYIKALSNPTSNVYDSKLYDIIRKKQKETSRTRNILGGQKSSYTSKVDNEEREKIAKYMVSNDLTIEEASIVFNIPTSTLYEYITSIKDVKLLEELKDLFSNHKRDSFSK